MKIAIDRGPLYSGDAIRGVGVYTRELIKGLESYINKAKTDIQIDPLDAKKDDLSSYDLVHYPYFNPYFLTLPKRNITNTVVTIHDLIPLLYPQQYPPGIKGKVKFEIQKLLLTNVDHVITVSETSKKDIIRLLKLDPEEVDVIYEAPRPVFKKTNKGKWQKEIFKKYNLPNSFVLYVGDVNYNKNILGLADACKLVHIPLVIVGKNAAVKNVDFSHRENESFMKFIKKYEGDPEVIRLGFVDDEDLVKIYNLASVYCQPSFYEGFGLSVLESFACNTPVVISKTQALTEVSDGAAYCADSCSSMDLAEALRAVLSDKALQKKLVKKGSERVRQFSWEKTARQTIAVYKKVSK